MKEVQTKGQSQSEIRATKQEVAVLKRVNHPNIIGYHNQATPDRQTGTGTHRRRTADTSTPSKQRDRYGVTHTTHRSDHQPSNSDSTTARESRLVCAQEVQRRGSACCSNVYTTNKRKRFSLALADLLV